MEKMGKNFQWGPEIAKEHFLAFPEVRKVKRRGGSHYVRAYRVITNKSKS